MFVELLTKGVLMGPLPLGENIKGTDILSSHLLSARFGHKR